MCTTDLECLQRIAQNTTTIKAFCYALAVLIATAIFLYAINKIIAYTIGS